MIRLLELVTGWRYQSLALNGIKHPEEFPVMRLPVSWRRELYRWQERRAAARAFREASR